MSVWNKQKHSTAICKGSGISVESLICMPKLLHMIKEFS